MIRISNIKFHFCEAKFRKIISNFKLVIGNWSLEIRERIFDKSKSGHSRRRRGRG